MIKKILLTSLFIFFLCTLSDYGLDLKTLNSMKYGKITIEGSNFINKNNIMEFLNIKEGDAFSYVEISLAVKRLFRMGLYEDIIVEYNIAGEGEGEHLINLSIRLSEKMVLREIIIVGENLPFKKNKLLEMLNLYKGKVVSASNISFAVENLRSGLIARGLDDFDLSYRINMFNNGIILVVRIKDLNYQRIRNIILKGVTENLEKSFEPIRKMYIGTILSQRVINDIEYSLSSLLINRGYRESRILGSEREIKGENAVEITFNVALNDRFATEIKGNKGFSENVIIENIPQVIDFINNPEEIEFIRDVLNRFYKDRGYFLIENEINVREIKKDFYLLQVIINEGKRYRVRDLFIEVDGILNRDIKQYLKLAPASFSSYPLYDRQSLEHDIGVIRNIFVDKGYLDVVIDYELDFIHEISQLVINLSVQKNQQYFLNEIVVDGEIYPENQNFFQGLREKYLDKPYSSSSLMDILDSIYQFYYTRGYIDFEVKLIADENAGNNKKITLEIYEGKIYRTGNLIYSGNLSTDENILYKNFQIESGLDYDTSLLFKLRQDLYNSGYFSNVFIEEYDYFVSMFDKDLIVHLEETSFGNTLFSIGYDSKEMLRTQAEISYLSLLGLGTDLTVGLKYSSLEEKYNIRINNKYLIMDTNVIFDIFKESLERSIRNEKINGASLIFSRAISETYLKVDLGYEYKNIESYEEAYKSSVIGSISATVIYDSRDNILFPDSGTLLMANIKYADTFLYSKHEFIRTFIRATKYFPFFSHVFVLSAQSGVNFPLYDKDNVPYSERYFLGGRLTMRGFERNSISPNIFGEPLGGNAMLLLNAELRFSIAYGFGLILFFDAGNVWQTHSDYDVYDLRTDAGIGIFYNTPIGPIRFDIGFNLSPKYGEKKGEYFLNFGHPF